MANAVHVIKNRENLIMTLNEYLIKKANPYHAANGQFTSENGGGDKAPVHISKPKEHHSEKVKAKFAEARSFQAQRLKNKRNAKKLGDIEEIMFYGVDQKGGKYASNEKIDSFIKQRKDRIKDIESALKEQEAKKKKGFNAARNHLVSRLNYDIERLNRANKLDQKTKRLNSKNPYAIAALSKTQKSELLRTLANHYLVKKANPYKDEFGHWTSKDKAKSVAEWFYEGGKEKIKRTSAGLAGALVGGAAGAGAGALAGTGLAAAGTSYLSGAAAGLTSIPLLGESLSGLAKASAPTIAGLATGAALGSVAGLGILGVGAGAYLGAKTAGAAVGGYLGARGGYEVGTALYDSNLSEKIEEWKTAAKDKASNQTDKLKDAATARVGKLKDQVNQKFNETKQKANVAIDNKAKQLKSAAKDKAAQAKELIKQKANEAKNQAKEFVKQKANEAKDKAKAAASSKLKQLTARYKPIKKYELLALRNA